MSSKASIPTQLYQANVDLAVRIAALLQENGKSWIGLFTDAAPWPDLQSKDGSFPMEALARMPTETAARLFRGDADYWKNLLSTAMRNQHQFAQGLRDAVEAWLASNRMAIGKAGGSVANLFEELPGVADLFGNFRDALEVPKQAANVVLKTTVARKPAPKLAPKPAPAKPVPPKPRAKTAAKPVAPIAKKKSAARKTAPVKAKPAAAKPAPARQKAPAKKSAAKRLAIVQFPKPML